jgi:hypothetical protein
MSDDPRIKKLAALVGKMAVLADQQAAVLRAMTEALEQPATGPSPVTRALTAFDGHWTAKHGPGRYQFAREKDTNQVKRLIKNLGLEEVERRMGVYFASREQFYVDKKHPFNLFVSQINAFGGGRPVGGTHRTVGHAAPTAGKYDFFDTPEALPADAGRPVARGDAGLPQPVDSRRGHGLPEVPAQGPDAVGQPVARDAPQAGGVDGVGDGRADRVRGVYARRPASDRGPRPAAGAK